MQANVHTLHGSKVTAMSLLFARYVAGQIADPAWGQIMNILDSDDTSTDERVALASFISDACNDLGPSEVEVPKIDEIYDFVSIARAA